MAHDIYQDRRMFFQGDRASIWHRLGHSIPANATWEEVRDLVQFYDVIERDVFAAGAMVGGKVGAALPDVKALIASDDGRYLSTVGRDYGVVQFSDMAKAVTEAVGSRAVFNVGGLLGENGQKGWLQAELPEPIMVKGGDVLKPRLLAYSGHDGRTPFTLANVMERAVCANTIAIALGEKGGFRVSVRHTSKALDYVQSASNAFSTIVQSFHKLGAWANLAASARMTEGSTMLALETFIPTPENEGARESVKDRVKSIQNKILDLYENHEIPETKGTAWAMFNALQGFAEHFAPIRGTKLLAATTDSARANIIAERSLFGAGADGSAGALAAVLAATGLPHPAQMTA